MIHRSSTKLATAIPPSEGAISMPYATTLTAAGRVWESALCWAVDAVGKSYQIILVSRYSVAGALQGTHQELKKTETLRIGDGRPVARINEDEFKVLTDGLVLRRVSATSAVKSTT